MDSFRFFAFLAVFLFHAGYLECGYLGVQAFFVLSGFLLTPILLDMKASLDRGQYFRNFYGRRVLRIFPLYYACLVAAALVLLSAWQLPALRQTPGVASSLAELPYLFTYTSDFYQAAHSGLRHTSPLFTHFWSLAVEEQFYLVWPFFLWLVPARRLPYWGGGGGGGGGRLRAVRHPRGERGNNNTKGNNYHADKKTRTLGDIAWRNCIGRRMRGRRWRIVIIVHQRINVHFKRRVRLQFRLFKVRLH
ncbi:MAG: acyltransferase [Nitrospinae bacterium]|nr:acyltransferase [Nitrospinota bacterium]